MIVYKPKLWDEEIKEPEAPLREFAAKVQPI